MESDPEVLKLAGKYFNSARLPRLKLVNEDALDFMQKNSDRFDLIIVDIYLDKYVPEQFEQIDFFNKVLNSLKPSGIMVFNKMICDASARRTASILMQNINSVFHQVTLLKVRERSENWIIVAK